MSSEKYLPVFALQIHPLAHRGNCIAQASTITLGLARRWRPKAPFLPKGKITAQDGITASAKSLGESDEERSIAIAARTVSQD